MGELNQPASRRTFRWPGAAREMVRTYLNSVPSASSGKDRYVCTWCEMHDGRLILIPTQQSKRRSQQVRYPAEATIVGRVTGVSMDLVVEPSEHEARA
jgi:hypothetical protein